MSEVIKNSDFVHIHVHSDYSRFDGLNRLPDLVLNARKMGFKSLALTDHGNIGGLVKFYTECKKTKDKKDNKIPYDTIKPILGSEFYLAKDHKARGKKEQVDGRKGNRHILLIAKNWQGWENLCTLSQKGFIDGQAFGDPRIDLDLLAKHSKGLICSSACLSSVVNNNLLNGRYEQAKQASGLFKEIFGEDFFLEVMYHGIEEEGIIIPDILKLGRELSIPVIASNDCHYCTKDQALSHELLMCMSTSKCLKDPKRYHFPYDEFYLKSAQEMYNIFGSHPETLLNTVALAERVEDFIKIGGMRLPNFNVESARIEIDCIEKAIDFGTTEAGKKYYQEIVEGNLGHSVSGIVSSDDNFNRSYSFLKELAQKGMIQHKFDKSQRHIDRLNMELGDIKIAWDSNRMDFATYLLIVWQYINYANSKGILVGPGRGSGYGSLTLRTLNITYGVDPLDYPMYWERFLSFDEKPFLTENDLGINENNNVTVDEIETSDDLDEERELEDDPGGVDRHG